VILAFVLAIAAGVLGGLFFFKFLIIGLCVMAFVAGFMAGGLLYNLVFIGWAKSQWLYGSCTFGLGTIGAILAYYWREHIIILSTSMIGAYSFIRGISFFAGGFPNEFTLYTEI